MRVGSLLTDQEVIRIAPSATTLEAARIMAEEHVGALLVASEDDSILGIFTERDLMVRVVAKKHAPESILVGDVMTKDVFTTAPDVEIAQLRDELQQRHIRHVPVIDDGTVLRVLSIRDLNRAYLKEKQHEVKAMTAYIRGEEVEAMQAEIERRKQGGS